MKELVEIIAGFVMLVIAIPIGFILLVIRFGAAVFATITEITREIPDQIKEIK